VTDLCGLSTAVPSGLQAQVGQAATLIAADTYFRAAELPSLPTTPDLFFRASAEQVCTLAGNAVVTTTAGAPFNTTDTATSIAHMVEGVMGIPASDTRHAQAIQILTDHLTAAQATTGVQPKDALVSTFVLACLAPGSVIVGL
jgi:hypothetical protein